MTISELSGIPRPTALRKLNNLLKRKLLKKDKNNLYLLFGLPKLDTNTIEKDVNLNSIMSNSFGFGGTNATLVFEKV